MDNKKNKVITLFRTNHIVKLMVYGYSIQTLFHYRGLLSIRKGT